MIEIKKLSSGYRNDEIIKDIDLTINDGSLTVLIGPNGSGKSTLLKTLCAQIKPAKGDIFIDGSVIRQIKPVQRAKMMSYLPQGTPLGETTVERYVLYGRYPYSAWPKNYSKEDRMMAAKAIERFGLTELSAKPLSCLSGGERQKAALALAFCQNSKNVLMDEPASFLDISAQFELMNLLRSFADEGKAVCAVLHDIPMALGFADSIAVMEKGRIAFFGNPQDAVQSGVIDNIFSVKVECIEGHFICRPK